MGKIENTVQINILLGIQPLLRMKYKVVQIWPGRFVCKQVTVYPGHIWTTLYVSYSFPPTNSWLLQVIWKWHLKAVRIF
jgi:hypothetical protein